MASTASGSGLPSPSTSTREETEMEQRPQAGPLPAKAPRLVGEIGYQDISEQPLPSHEDDEESVDLGDGPEVDSTEGLTAAEADARNGRHPADRSNVNLASESTSSPPNPAVPSQHQPSASTTSLNTTSKHSIFSFHSISSKSYGGVTFKTIARLALLIAIISGLIIAWVFAAMHLSQASKTDPSEGGTSAIFIHVAFGIIILILIIFLERAVFQLRAERYAHVHPGEILPSHRHRRGIPDSHSGSGGMAFAPWNRPPLPTYAAALGVRGTGDVEDSIIAAPPPPAYGNTRGSTLLLASFVRRSRASAHGDGPWQIVDRPGQEGRMSGVSARSLPISYDEVEHQSDAERARILEESLAKLEDGGGSRQPSTAPRR